MDYVKETLERQNALWRALFLGSAVTAAEEETARRSTDPAGRTAEAVASPALSGAAETADSGAAALTGGEYAAAARRGREESEAAQTSRQEGRERPRTERRFLRGTETAEETEAIRRRPAETRAPGGRTARRSGDAPVERVSRETESRPPRGGELEAADARAISRRFERDARRYDGGFIFY